MPLLDFLATSNTFRQWLATTNNLISTISNTSVFVLVSQNATPDTTTGNVSINGTMTIATVTANGTITANVFSGNGVSLTTLNASALATGTVPDARLSGTYTLITANNSTYAFGKSEGALNVNSATQATNATNLNSEPGSYYTNASNLSTGTLAIARLDANVILTTSTTGINASALSTGTMSLDRLDANVILTTTTTGINASALSIGTVPLGQLDANVLLTTSTTGINASALSTGTVPLARLSSANTTANGAVDTTTQTFAGDKTFQNAASFSNTVSITGAANTLSTLGIGGTLNALGLLGVSGNATFGQDVVVTGNLTISGTTTYINTTNLQIGDNIIALNADLPSGNAPTENAGIEVNRGSSANTYLRWNEMGDVWEVTNDGTNYGTVIDTRSTTGVNASALSTGTLPDGRLSGAYTGVTSLALGANVVANVTTVFVGNSTANVSHTATSVSVANSTNTATLTSTSLTIGGTIANTTALVVPATSKVYLDGGGDTYITESSANVLSLYSGDVESKLTSGVLTVSGFGTHSFSAGGTGANQLNIRNTTAGTGNYAALNLGNDSSATRLAAYATSSTYTPVSFDPQDGGVIVTNGAGGLSIAASSGSGDVRIYSRNALALTLGASQAATFTGTIAWGGGSAITSSDHVAVLADNETVTGAWTFSAAPAVTISGTDNTNLALINSNNNAGVATSVAMQLSFTNSVRQENAFIRLTEAGVNSDAGTLTFVVPQSGGSATNTWTFAGASGATTLPGTLAWGGGSAISSSSNVALLNAANVFTNNNTFAEDVRIYRSAGTTTGYINFGASGTNYFGYSGSGFVANGSLLVGSLLTVSGFGTHSFSAGGTGVNEIVVANTTSGAGNYARALVQSGTNTGGGLYAYSQGFATSGISVASGMLLYADGVGGLTLAAGHGSGDVRIYSRNALAATFGASQAATFTNTLAWGGGSAISSSNNVALLNAANVFTAGTQSIRPSASNVELQLDASSSSYYAQLTYRQGATYTWNVYANTGATPDLIWASGSGGDVRMRLSAAGLLTVTGDVSLAATKKLYLDGGSDTYIYEVAANNIRFVAGGNNIASFGLGSTDAVEFFGSLTLQTTKKLYLDGGGDTYIHEVAANQVNIVTGGSTAAIFLSNQVYLQGAYSQTTASAANVFVESDGQLRRSTSSLRYKHDITTLETADAMSTVMALRPITYRGKTDADQRRYVGFIAEEVAAIAPLLATYDEGGESGTPNYVTYDRVTAYLVAVVQQQQAEINALKAQMKEKQ